MKHLFFLLGIFFNLSIFSQGVLTPFEDWAITAGTQNFFQKSTVKTDPSKNTYIVGATVNSAGNYDILLTKINSTGTIAWTKQYDGLAHSQDRGVDEFIDGSGNVYITGEIVNDTISGYSDVFTMKFNSSGVQQWISTYNGSGSLYDAGSSITVDGSGNVFIGGSSFNTSANTDFLALKYNSSGTQQWAVEYNGTSGMNDAASKVTIGTNLTVSGLSQTATTSYKPLTLKLNLSTGAFVSATYGSTGSSSMDVLNDFTIDASGNGYFVGGTPVAGHGYDFSTIKVTSAGAVAWEVDYNGASSLDDYANSVAVDASGNVYVTGFVTSSAGQRDMTTIKYNSSGTQQWIETYNDSLNGNDEGKAIVLSGTDIYVTGYDSTIINGTDYYTVKYDNSGIEQWHIRADGDAHLADKATNIAVDTANNIVVSGESKKADGTYEYKTIRYIEHNTITPTDFNSETPPKAFEYYGNRGQLVGTDSLPVPTVHYYTTNFYPDLFFKDHSVSMVFGHVDTVAATTDTLHRIDLTFDNAVTSSKTYPQEEQPDYLNYFLAQCPQGITEVHGNQKLVTADLYTNIDVQYSSNQNGLKYYFIVKPGGTPSNIKLTFTGASSCSLDTTAHSLTINSSIGSIKFDRPTVYQVNSSNVIVPITTWHADWLTNGASNKFKFNLGTYDNTKTLIIEVDLGNSAHFPWTSYPITAIGNLEHSTYYGGNDYDSFNDIRTDASGNSYLAGYTKSTVFPGAVGLSSSLSGAGSSDGFVVKFNSGMKRIWGTYIGGNGDDDARSVDVSGGNVFFTGTTKSTNFPHPTSAVAGAFNDFSYGGAVDDFVAKLNGAGTALLWSTYLGGSGAEDVNRLRFDIAGDFYIAGQGTSASPLKTKTGAFNSTSGTGYITKFNNADTLVWGSLIPATQRLDYFAARGGSDGLGYNCFTAKINASGFPLVKPLSTSYKDSTFNGVSDVGIVMLTSNDTIHWSTIYGGNNNDFEGGVAFDGLGDLYVGGNTLSNDFSFYYPGGSAYIDSIGDAGAPAIHDAFLLKFSKDGVRKYATFYGGTLAGDDITEVVCDAHNNVYCAGYTGSNDYPVDSLAGGFMEQDIGTPTWTTGFIVAFNSSLHRLWSTYYGGTNNDVPWGIAYQNNKLYLSGGTYSEAEFPLVNLGGGAWYKDTLNNGAGGHAVNDGFIARFDLTPVVTLGVTEHETAGNTSMIVYPNPGNGVATLQITLDKQTDVKINIVSTLGQVVYQKQLKNKVGVITENVDLSGMADGVYFISVTTNKERIATKIVKQ